MKIPGVYSIRNVKSKKVYVGSSVDVQRRFIHHRCLLNRGKHWNTHLQASFYKHGLESFTFELLEVCLIGDLVLREQFWIDSLKAFGRGGYNMLPAAGSTRGRKYRHTQETKDKLSAVNKGVPRPQSESHKKAHRMAMEKRRGVGFSEYHRLKISLSKLGHSVSDETKLKISATLRARYK